MKKFFRWIPIFNKRIWKDIGFIFIIVFIPLVVFVFDSVAKEKSGMMTIAVSVEGREDEAAKRAVSALVEDNSVINFFEVDDIDDAIDMVSHGEADAAWRIPGNLSEAVEGYLFGKDKGDAIFFIYENEDSVFLTLTHEKLFAKVYADLIYGVYKDFIRNELVPEVSEEELYESYIAELSDESLFEFEVLGGEVIEEDEGYLAAPINGLLSLIMLSVGMAVMMKIKRDSFKGNMVRLNARDRFVYVILQSMTALFGVALDIWLSLYVFGFLEKGKALYELLLLILLALSIMSFCYFVAGLIRNVELYCCVFIFIIFSSLVMCPILINVNVPILKNIYPSYFYLLARRNPAYILNMLIYSLACMTVGHIANRRFR